MPRVVPTSPLAQQLPPYEGCRSGRDHVLGDMGVNKGGQSLVRSFFVDDVSTAACHVAHPAAGACPVIGGAAVSGLPPLPSQMVIQGCG